MARLVFDLDGTLVDSAPTLAATGNRMLAELGRPPVSLETCIGFIGHGVRHLVGRLLDHTGGVPSEGVEPWFRRFRAIYDADPLTGTVVYPGVPAALAALAGAGHGLGVCTQKFVTPARAILEGLDLMPPIEGLTGGDSVGVLKPDPRMLAHAADQLPPGPVLYVGDSLTDAETAQAAGVPFLLHARGYRLQPVEALPHAAVFDDFADLPALVAALA